MPYPSRLNKEKIREKDDILASKFMEIFRNLHFELSFADALIHMPKFAPMFKKMLNNKDKLIELTKTPLNENCSAVVLKKLPEKARSTGFSEFCFLQHIRLQTLIRLFLLSIPTLTRLVKSIIYSMKKPKLFYAIDTLTPFGDSDFLLLEEADTFLAITDDPTSPEFDEAYYDPEGDILLLESLLNSDPSPLLNKESYLPEIKKELKVCKSAESSIDEPPEVVLKDLPPHLEYAFLADNNKLHVIIAKDLSDDEKTALIKVLKSRKQAIAWKLSDIRGIDPEFCSHKILLEDDYEPSVQH
ncbi:hypothetical protein Tco_0704176 [Tanacetum coccineum]|uniref:Reverse transcriptase domain-containing protein n=1 Tax=Tanacetum coccineum TaxID=301880 RepID=A0ABQ4Y2R8_9ASTR